MTTMICDLCGKTFSSLNKWTTHLAVFHRQIAYDVPLKRRTAYLPFNKTRCWCGQDFDTVIDPHHINQSWAYHLFHNGGVSNHILGMAMLDKDEDDDTDEVVRKMWDKLVQRGASLFITGLTK